MAKTHEMKSTLTLILPLMAAFLAQKGMQLIDTLMMGWLGPDALAAGAIGMAIFITTLVFCMGTLSAVGVFISRAKGADDKENVSASLQNGIWLAVFLSLPCVGVIWFAPHFFISQENGSVIQNAAWLLHGLSMGLPGYLLFLVFREFISAFSMTRIVMWVTAGSVPLTFLLNDALIYGKWGLPRLGVSGIGYAGAAVMWFMFFSLFFYSLKNRQLKKYLPGRLLKPSLMKMKDMLFIGVPSGTFFLLESAMFLSAIMIIGHFGVDALASFQITMQCVNVAYAIPFSLAMATGLQVSHALGAGELARIKKIALQNFSLGISFSLGVAIIFLLFPGFFINLFLDNKSEHVNAIRMASSFLMIAGFFVCLDAVQAIANGMLRGLKDTLIPMLFSVGCYWVVALPAAWYLSFHTALAARGVWYGITIGICSLGATLMLRLVQKFKSGSF